MSDRSYSRFITLQRDRKTVRSFTYYTCVDPVVRDGLSEEWIDEDAPDGGCQDSDTLAKVGIPFIHQWSACVGAYDAGVSFHDGTRSVQFLANDKCDPAFTCHDFQLTDDRVTALREHLAFAAKVRDMLSFI